MQMDENFAPAIEYLDLESIQNSRDVVYIVDQTLHLRAFNNAWVQFARENDGENVTSLYPLGCNIISALPGALKDYFMTCYMHAIDVNQPFEHDYECPSSRQYRKFHQSAYPLINAAGLVLSNHLVEMRSHIETPQEFSARFIDQNGIITQCCNCRKLRDPSDPSAWLWVPQALDINYSGTSHGICPRCYDFYYPEIDENSFESV